MREINDNTNQIVEVNKHLSLSLDESCDFNVQIDNKINKRNKLIDISIFRVSVLERWYRKLLFFYKIHGQCQQYQAIKIKLFNGIYPIVNFYTYYYTDQNYLVLK